MPRKIRILETIRQGKIGGGESHVLDLVRSLDREQFEPVVLAFTPGPMIDRLAAWGVTTHVIETERPFDATKWGRVRQLLRQERIDLVHAHGTRALSNTFWAAKQLGLPLMYTVHGWSFHMDQKPLLKSYRQLSEKLLMAQTDVTICVSDSNYRDGLAFSDMARAVVVKYGIDLEKFNPRRAPSTDVRAELGIRPDTLLVGYIARITTQKDPFTLLRAAAALPADLDVTFLVVGGGELKPEALRLAQELNLGERVRFVDFRQDVPELLQAVDIYCLPSLWEGLPIGVLEAMAMEKAVVASAVDGTKEAIEHGRNGLLVAPRAPEQLAAAIRQLAADRQLLHTLGQNAGQTVRTHHAVAGMTRQVEQLYRQLQPTPPRLVPA